jgi:integrase/recombinase XerC
MKKTDPFPALLRSFFHEWLAEQRNASLLTIGSYRDTRRLFLRFVAERKRCEVAKITLADLTASEVSAFLGYAEHERQGTIGTRNCRLAAIRSFFNFVAGKEPTSIAQCTEVLAAPIKRASIPAPCYLEPREVEAILAQPDRSTLEGLRDHALQSFLYNSGARTQEALDLWRRVYEYALRMFGSAYHLPSVLGGKLGFDALYLAAVFFHGHVTAWMW